MCTMGLDIGYFGTKLKTDRWERSFPSVVGSPDEALFSLNGDEDIILQSPHRVAVGATVVDGSLWQRRRQDRFWWASEEWDALFLAALSEALWTCGSVTLTAGLPAAWYSADKDEVRAKLLGEHKFRRKGRKAQTVVVSDARVLPQGVGVAMSVIFDDQGQVQEWDLFNSDVGVVDVGSNTTNLVPVRKLRVLDGFASPEVGAWKAVEALKRVLAKRAPGLRLADHEVSGILKSGKVWVDGESLDLTLEVNEILDDFASSVSAEISQQWNGARRYRYILIAGGSAHLIGARLCQRYKQARVVNEPHMANAVGYWKFSQRISGVSDNG